MKKISEQRNKGRINKYLRENVAKILVNVWTALKFVQINNVNANVRQNYKQMKELSNQNAVKLFANVRTALKIAQINNANASAVKKSKQKKKFQLLQ